MAWLALVGLVAGCSAILGLEDTVTDGDASPAALRIIATEPANGATDVLVTSAIEATFSADLDTATISPSTFTLESADGAIEATVLYADRTATLMPPTRLPGGAFLTAKIASSVTDQTGESLGIDFTWTFESGFGMTDVNAVLEYTVRDIPPDGTPDVFVGGTPPADLLFIKAGTEDRAIVEFDLAAVPAVLQSATFEFEMSTLDPGGSSTRVHIYIFDADGVPQLTDFSRTSMLFAEFFGPNTSTSETKSFDVSNFLRDAKARNVSHIGFLFRATDTIDRYDVVPMSTAADRAPRLRVVH